MGRPRVADLAARAAQRDEGLRSETVTFDALETKRQRARGSPHHGDGDMRTTQFGIDAGKVVEAHGTPFVDRPS
jgi:hypothetical protein